MSNGTGTWRRWLNTAVGVIAWSATIALYTALILRIYYYDADIRLIWLNAFTLYLYLPAYVCLIWACIARRWCLAGWNVLLVSFHLMWVGPDFLPAVLGQSESPAAVRPSSSLRIFCANVYAENSQYQPLFDEIAAAQPDVVVIVEYTRGWYNAIKASTVMADYTHRVNTVYLHGGGIGVFSRIPLSSKQQQFVRHRLTTRFDVSLEGQLVRVLCLHGPRPMHLSLHYYDEYWEAVSELIVQEPQPLIVLGDFNATQYSRLYRELTAGRLRGAHEAVGRGYATTWPNGRVHVPPVRIDHVLFTDDLECLSIVEGQGVGSDHRPLVVDFRLDSTSVTQNRPGVVPGESGP